MRRSTAILATIAALWIPTQLRAVPEQVVDQDTYMSTVPGQLVILGSGTDFIALQRQAESLSKRSHVRFSMEGRFFDPDRGYLTMTDDDGIGGYALRNIADERNGPYISIEKSDAYPGLRKGLYIIVAKVTASSSEARAAVAEFKKFVPGVYAPHVTIYIGCRH